MEHRFSYPKVNEILRRPEARQAQERTARPTQRDLVRASLLRQPGKPRT